MSELPLQCHAETRHHTRASWGGQAIVWALTPKAKAHSEISGVPSGTRPSGTSPFLLLDEQQVCVPGEDTIFFT